MKNAIEDKQLAKKRVEALLTYSIESGMNAEEIEMLVSAINSNIGPESRQKLEKSMAKGEIGEEPIFDEKVAVRMILDQHRGVEWLSELTTFIDQNQVGLLILFVLAAFRGPISRAIDRLESIGCRIDENTIRLDAKFQELRKILVSSETNKDYLDKPET